MNKEGSFMPILIIMLITLAIAFFWESLAFIKNAIHIILDPSAGALLDWNIYVGMFAIVIIVSIITTLVQKYGTDQKTLREMKAEQKELSEEMKKYKNHPEKMMELNKRNLELMGPMMKLSMRPIVYTGIPFILLFRWFNDYFSQASLEEFRFFGFLSWLWFYLIFAIIFGSILRRKMKVV